MALTGFRRVRRRVVAALVGAAVVVSLSGCWVADLPDLFPTPGPTPSGHADQLSREQAAALIEQVPGIHSATIGGYYSGMYRNMVVKISIDDPAMLESPKMIEFLFAVGWATTDLNPNNSIEIEVYPTGPGTLLELQPQVNAIFGTTLDRQDAYISALVGSDVLEERWGPWPGAIPEVPVVVSPTPG